MLAALAALFADHPIFFHLRDRAVTNEVKHNIMRLYSTNICSGEGWCDKHSNRRKEVFSSVFLVDQLIVHAQHHRYGILTLRREELGETKPSKPSRLAEGELYC
jgi:hypothetical protein